MTPISNDGTHPDLGAEVLERKPPRRIEIPVRRRWLGPRGRHVSILELVRRRGLQFSTNASA